MCGRLETELNREQEKRKEVDRRMGHHEEEEKS